MLSRGEARAAGAAILLVTLVPPRDLGAQRLEPAAPRAAVWVRPARPSPAALSPTISITYDDSSRRRAARYVVTGVVLGGFAGSLYAASRINERNCDSCFLPINEMSFVYAALGMVTGGAAGWFVYRAVERRGAGAAP